MEELSRPSGISIPLFLKRKWEKQQHEQRAQDSAEVHEESKDQSQDTNDDGTSNNVNVSENDNEKPSPAIWQPQLRLSQDQELTRDGKNELSNRVFTASELEERIWKTTSAMYDIQRQLYRGEEIYYDDTYSHGSIYKGWDAFVDSTSAVGSGGTQTSSNRRVPADSRWFSTSCGSVSRTKPPATFPPPLTSQPALSLAKLAAIPEQQKAGTTVKETPQSLLNPSSTVAATPTLTLPKSNTETVQPSSARIRQRMAASAAASSSTVTRSVEKGDTSGTSSTPKLSSRPATLIGDSGSNKKKRKTITTIISEEPPSKKASQKSTSDEITKRLKTASTTTKTAATSAGTTKGSKSDRDASITKGGPKSTNPEQKEGASSTPGTKSNKSETSFTPAKREKEIETLVPRKRGRPRRKS